MPVAGRKPAVVAGAPGHTCFAPAAVAFGGRRLLAFTAGPEAGRHFGTRLHADGTAEPWYCGGRNRVRVTEIPAAGVISPGDGVALPAPPGTLDMTGASLAADGHRLRAWYGTRGQDGAWRICHCASSDAGQTWSAPVPVLAPGPAGGTDSEHVLLPAVLRSGDGWLMWYAGRDGSSRRIHLARSADGITWDRHGVVLGLGPDGSPDAYAADCPAVAVAPDGTLVMLYGAGTSRSVAAAVSRDGIVWDRLGPLVHRGAPGGPDSGYAFYPALLPAGPGAAELLYAGEDDQGHWQVLTDGALDLTAVAARRPPMAVPPHVPAAVAVIRGCVPAKYLEEPGDCHSAGTPAWRSADGRISQLRPSTLPVFTVRAPDSSGAVVVKLSRSRHLAEREADGGTVLSRWLPVPAMALHYDQADRGAAVVLEYLDAAPLRDLAEAGDDRFLPVLADVCRRLALLTAETTVPAAGAEAAQTRQTPDVTAAWTRDIAAALAPWAGSPLWLNGQPLGLTPAQVTSTALRAAGQPPAVLALSSGDVHLGNILVAPSSGRWHLIDLEFAGYHDPDRVAAGLLASLLKHAGLITAATADIAGGEIRVTAALRGDAARQLLDTPAVLGTLAAGACDPARVFAFMVASLRFRLASGPPGTLPPARALAMLGLAARMTGQDQP